MCQDLVREAWRCDRRGLCPALLCTGRGLSIRLEPRGCADRGRDGDGQGRPCPALPQPDDVRPGLYARESGASPSGSNRWRLDGSMFDAHDRAFAFFKGACARGIYDSVHCPPLGRGEWARRPAWRRCAPAKSGNTAAVSCRCEAITLSSQSPALRRQAGRRARSRTRLG